MAEEINSVEIGKYTLESLTTGMYSDPKITYREYIQNSVDSLENAVKLGLLEPQNMRINIIIDENSKKIIFEDNGTGVYASEARNTLLSIGSSKKHHTMNRGFRGIGRLSGMTYCDELVFQTSSIEENIATIMRFNCKRLRELLIPGQYENYDLATVLEEVTEITEIYENPKSHYFYVIMNGVSDISDLLNYDEVRNYISQVAPVPYRVRYFNRASDIHKFVESAGYQIDEFPIFLGKSYDNLQHVYKPNRHRFHSNRNKKKNDEILDVKYFTVNIDNDVYAIGWYACSNWFGTISEGEIAGIRARKGNILIGDSTTLNPIFKESRFNGWVQGELFIVTDMLIPNARRDDFERNDAYFKLMDELSKSIGTDISKLIREASQERNDNSAKIINETSQIVKNASSILTEGFNSSVEKTNVMADLLEAKKSLKKVKPKTDSVSEKKEKLAEELQKKINEIEESTNFKINRVNTSIDRKSRKILEVVSDILSEKLAKFLVDEIIDEIIIKLNKNKV